MPQSTPAQRAQWRITRAEKAGRDPLPRDIEIVEQEKLTKQNLKEQQEQQQYQSAPQDQTHSLQLLPPPQKSENERDLKGTGGAPRKLSAREKSWNDFFSNRFGPFCVLILWFAFADIDKASFYAPSPDECKTAAIPLSKLMSAFEDWLNFPSWAHDIIVSTDDVVTLGMVAMSYLDRIGMLNKLAPYFSGTAARMKEMSRNEKEPIRPNESVPSNGQYDASTIYGIGSQWQPI